MRSMTCAVLLTLLLTPATASAWRAYWCDGAPSRWPRGEEPVMIVDSRWGDPATDWGQALRRGMTAWNDVAGARAVFDWRYARLDRIIMGNGRSEVAVVHPRTIDGSLGLTRVRRRQCVILIGGAWTNRDIQEADVLIADHPPDDMRRLPFPNCDRLDRVSTREATIIHEFGHALGLQHEDHQMALMMSRNGEGRYCGSPQYAPHPDDIAGLRRLYGEHNPRIDLAASAFEWDGADRIAGTMDPATLRLCPGAIFTVDWAIANRGTAAERYDVFWYASRSSAFNSPEDVLLGLERDLRIDAPLFETRSTTLRMSRHLPPDVPHHVGFLIEPQRPGEVNRANNLGYPAIRVVRRPEEECR